MSHECNKAQIYCMHYRELEYCPHCGKVYCKRCGKEWPETEYVYRSYPVYPWHVEPYRPYITWASGNSGDFAKQSETVTATLENSDGQKQEIKIPVTSGTAVYCNHHSPRETDGQ